MHSGQLVFRAFLTVLILGCALDLSEAADRRRPARPSVTSATLTGRATDAVSGAAVFEVVVNVQGKDYLGDRQGVFNIGELAPGTAAVTFKRWGYEPVTRTVQLQLGNNTVDVTMAPKPVVTFSNSAGTQFRLDRDSVGFVFRGALTGFTDLEPLDLCRTDGTPVTAKEEELATVLVTGQPVRNNPCCPNSDAVPVSVTLKSGDRIDGVVPLCKYYAIDFIGRDRTTGEWVYTKLEEVGRVDFP